ncbi:MAG: hypothetical protein JNL11_08150 [Bdellovibrionaceae bacterium]|nr:hypothetical protein [Pseudobdellovibrionaceae bacterium]
MGWKLIPFVILCFVVFIVYALYSRKVPKEQAERTIVKRTSVFHTHEDEIDPTSSQSLARPLRKSLSKSLREVASGKSAMQVTVDDRINPMTNPYLAEKKERTRKVADLLTQVTSEAKRPLDLQFVGNDHWSFFLDLQVSKHQAHDSLFSFGPFHVSRRPEQNQIQIQNQMTLVFNERQKTLGVLTGRLVVKVRDHYDIDPIAREYNLKLDKFSPEIRTGYVSAVEFERFAPINMQLKTDQRIERFYFEIVNVDLVKN